MRRIFFAMGTMVLLTVVFLVGCEDERNEPPQRHTPAFSHKLHVIEQELKCTVCHKTASKGEQAGMPTIKSCMKCHEGLDEKKTPEHRIDRFLKDDQPQFSNVTALSKEIKFSHKVHGDAKVQCATCHKGIEISTLVSSRLKLSMKDCLDCHAQTHVGNSLISTNSCNVCHTDINKQWKPESHKADWKLLHGRAAGFRGDKLADNCSLCHTQQSCSQCHKAEAPANHTNFWRERGHGITADLDRSTCKVCHNENTCIRCHQSTPPASHHGNFESQHCQGCHLPLKDNGCIACHRNTNSHLAAPRLPNTKVHTNATASDCRTCHFGLKLQHIDNGDNCLSCHRR